MNKLSIVFILLSFLCVSTGFCQWKFIKQGDEFLEKKDYASALNLYFQALQQDPQNATTFFKIGTTYLLTENREMAVPSLERAYTLNPEIDPKILYYLGIAYQSKLRFDRAIYMYENYKKMCLRKEWEEIDMRISQCIISQVLVKNPVDLLIENAGSSVNSKYDDYCPIISADETTMIFTSTRNNDSLNLKAQAGYEDIYIAHNESGEWNRPGRIGHGLNMGHHDAAASLSPDGKTLYIYYDFGYGDVYFSTLNDKGEWSKPAALNKNINTPMFKETYASVSADGKRLFFSSNRPGGKGGLDVYMSTLSETGEWGKAVNLGDLVNTSGNEDSPYLHPDGVTLYFSSDGHPGMGSADIFKSDFKDNKWQKPENLGYPLNSLEYDGFFNISYDKRTAYFATKRKYGVGGYDILKATYRNVTPVPAPVIASVPVITTPAKPVDVTPPSVAKQEKVAPKKVTPPPPSIPAGTYILQGKALDKASLPLKVSISVVNDKTKKQVASLESNATTGAYEFKILDAGSYVLTAEKDGYLFNTINITVPQASGASRITTDFIMQKADVGSVMILKNLLFDTGKADLKPSSILELEKVRKLLLANPSLKVQINGHTDNVGDLAANKLLSLKRALAVVNHLALNGIEFDRLSAKGYGAERPIATNDDEYGGRQLNRRTEIEIVNASPKI